MAIRTVAGRTVTVGASITIGGGVAGTDVDAGAVTGDYEELGRRTLNAAP